MFFKEVEAKPDFVALEKKLLSWWYKSGLVKKYLHQNDKKTKRFSFLDGPITANNPMGVHHAWGRTLKDLYQRYHHMKGEKERFQNGFDCQGLWVEVEVEKELGFKNKKDIEKYGIDKFVEKCKERVRKFAQIQTKQSQRLGYFMDWENSYYTMSDENNYMIWYFLKKCWQHGWLYQGRDVVPWCPRCGTAISQHEILTEDYQEIKHESVFFKLKTRKPRVSFLAWTTTPWTIPANVALAVDPKLDYVLVEQEGEKLILAKERIKILKGDFRIVEEFKGEELVGLNYQAPFDDLPRLKQGLGNYQHRVVAADASILPVNIDEGTGIVHLATAAGSEDFALGQKEKLPVLEIVDEEGNYLNNLGFLTQQNAKKHPEIIINYLKTKEKGIYFYKTEKIKHRYPVCWRCKTELIWRLVDEWYIAMDKCSLMAPKTKDKEEDLTLRQKMIKVAKKIKWLPQFGLERELDWLTNMHDWLISKKRYWGLALPIWTCPSCGKFQVIGSYEELKEAAVQGWQEFLGHSPHRPWVDKIKIRCLCGAIMTRIKDVGNPWLDAGIVPFSTLNYLKDRSFWQLWYPADFITESFPGQFKNWFYSLIAMATVLEGTPPFKTVLGFGTLLGEDGRPMHKSWGNAIEFNEGADKIGVDVMRWLYCLAEPSRNLLFGCKLAEETRRRFHLIFWNVYKFFVTNANLYHFKPADLNENSTDLKLLDEWLVSRLNQLIKTVTFKLDQYHHAKAAAAIESFVVEDLSAWYVRRSRQRKESLSVLYPVLITLSKLLAPFNPFLAEEIFKNLTKKESVHLATWPRYHPEKIKKDLEKQMQLVRNLCKLFHAQRRSFKIKVKIPLKKATYKAWQRLVKEMEELIKEECNIYELSYQKSSAEGTFEIEADFTKDNLDEEAGEAREIIRRIQIERKRIGCQLNDWLEVILPHWPERFTKEIKKRTLTKKLIKGEQFKLKVIKT